MADFLDGFAWAFLFFLAICGAVYNSSRGLAIFIIFLCILRLFMQLGLKVTFQ